MKGLVGCVASPKRNPLLPRGKSSNKTNFRLICGRIQKKGNYEREQPVNPQQEFEIKISQSVDYPYWQVCKIFPRRVAVVSYLTDAAPYCYIEA